MAPLPRPWFGRFDAATAERFLARGREATPTYAPVGRLLDADPPTPDLDVRRELGTGREVFAAARSALHRMVPQDEVFAVWPAGATADLGATILVTLGLGPVALVAVNRIVGVVDEPDRWGYAYGTLPGHPESGEEAFLVEIGPDEAVVGRITTRAVVALPGGRLLQRLSVPIQRRAATRYLDALEAAVTAT